MTDDDIEIVHSSSITQILDPENTDPIILFSEAGEKLEFQQVALVPLDGEVYVILRPISGVEGMDQNDAVVFVIQEDEDNLDFYLDVVYDVETIDKVFKLYQEMFERAMKERSGEAPAQEEVKETEKEDNKKPGSKK